MIGAEDIARLTGVRGEGGRLHLVVMDAHRELNELNELGARIATESIDGARAYDIADADRNLIRAFMRGVHSTEKLKFDHPGLGTVATRTGSSLLIQNDLGTTDAHIVEIRLTGPMVTITYTDVHLERLLFLQDLFASWQVAWEDTRSRSDKTMEGGVYHLASARFDAGDDAELDRFLEALGSRLVFLIDWNKARKRLRRLVSQGTAIKLLRWSAERGYGHMAFLRAGADGLVYEALEFAGGRVARAGESLQDVLGKPAAEQYMRAVLRICSDGLLSGGNVSLVQDEARAELIGYLRSARQEILALALRHAELSVEIAEGAHDALEQAIAGAENRCRATAGRAHSAEHDADALVTEARQAVVRAPDLGPFRKLVETADDIADCAEKAAFYATLLPAGQPAGEVRPQVRRIAQLVLSASRAYLRAVQLSVELRRGGPREDMDAFLAAAHQAIELERETDLAQRAVHQALVAEPEPTSVALFVIVELTRAFEEAADALMHSARLLREQALARVVRSEASLQRETEPASSRPTEPTDAGEYVYVLGDRSVAMPDVTVIGGKAYGLARLERAGLRIPDAAVLKTSLSHSRAIPASLGVATGPLALDRDAVDRIARTGTPPVLVRADTVTEDVAAVAISAGVLTGAGGRTAHAAVVARELGKPCLVGCCELVLDLTARTARIGTQLLSEGDIICLDAEAGLVYSGAPAVTEDRPTQQLAQVAAWRADVSAEALTPSRPEAPVPQ